MEIMRIDAHEVECPLFSDFSGLGVRCASGCMSGRSYIVSGHTAREMEEHMARYCCADYDGCPVYLQTRARLMAAYQMYRDDHPERGDV